MTKIKNLLTRVREIKDNPLVRKTSYIFVLLILFFIIVTESLTIIRMRWEIADLNQATQQYQNDNKMLEQKIEKMDTDKYIEQMARERLDMVKIGETPVQIQINDGSYEKPKTLETQEKVGVYMKDWYIKLEEWVQEIKKK